MSNHDCEVDVSVKMSGKVVTAILSLLFSIISLFVGGYFHEKQKDKSIPPNQVEEVSSLKTKSTTDVANEIIRKEVILN